MHKKSRGELNSVFTQSWRGCLCACASDVCAENFSYSARLLLQQSRASFMLALCLRAVLISSPDTWDWMRMHALAVMHRWTLYENVDSAKIKVPFYTTDIYILRVTSMHRIVIHRIDPYRLIVTPVSVRKLLINTCRLWGGGHESKCLASSLNAALDRRQFPPQTQDYHDTDE